MSISYHIQLTHVMKHPCPYMVMYLLLTWRCLIPPFNSNDSLPCKMRWLLKQIMSPGLRRNFTCKRFPNICILYQQHTPLMCYILPSLVKMIHRLHSLMIVNQLIMSFCINLIFQKLILSKSIITHNTSNVSNLLLTQSATCSYNFK